MPRIYKPGSFLRIPLTDGSFGYGRVLKLPHDAYYDYRTDTPDSDLDRIASKRVLNRGGQASRRSMSFIMPRWMKASEDSSLR
ncbi:Imm26 family immunity protein [Archangium minus]|uniref:Imm26 family immunity protein n=1 Tax=Archangium minus TaxID=83450 RepID=UPI0037BFC81A